METCYLISMRSYRHIVQTFRSQIVAHNASSRLIVFVNPYSLLPRHNVPGVTSSAVITIHNIYIYGTWINCICVYIAHCYPLDIYIYNTIHMYSGITSGSVLNGELLYTKILEVNLFAFAYRQFRRDFSPLDGTYCMGTDSFLQLYMYFVLIWEGFMNG